MIKIDGKEFVFSKGDAVVSFDGMVTCGIDVNNHFNKIEVHHEEWGDGKSTVTCTKLRDEVLERINTELVPVYQRRLVHNPFSRAWSDCTRGEYKIAVGLDDIETRILYKKVML